MTEKEARRLIAIGQGSRVVRCYYCGKPYKMAQSGLVNCLTRHEQQCDKRGAK